MGSENAPIASLIQTVLAIIVIIIFGGSIYAFVLAIFQFVFSKGEAEKVKKAWFTIRYMILGIILSIFLLFLFPIIFEKLNVNGYQHYTAKKIFQRAGYLIKGIIETTTNTENTIPFLPKQDENKDRNYDNNNNKTYDDYSL